MELKTGRILARISGEAADNPSGYTATSSSTTTTPTSTARSAASPRAYPAASDKWRIVVYVGDIDGTLWRVDLHDADPKAWTADIAFDAYNFGSTGNSTMTRLGAAAANSGEEEDPLGSPEATHAEALVGQPIQNAPLLSLARKETRGDVRDRRSGGIPAEVPDMVNLLISFPDVLRQRSRPTQRLLACYGAAHEDVPFTRRG